MENLESLVTRTHTLRSCGNDRNPVILGIRPLLILASLRRCGTLFSGLSEISDNLEYSRKVI